MMKPNILIKQFPDGESYMRVRNLRALKNKNVTIYKRFHPEPEKNIFELLLSLSVIKKATSKISVLVPYLSYARQDRENKTGEAVSADVLCGILKNFGVKKLITYDCHFLPRPGKFIRVGLRIENRSAKKILLDYAKKYFRNKEFTVISPDQGAAYLSHQALHKTRKDHKIHKIEGEVNVKGRNVCILDDIIASGGTILKAIKHLKKLGAKRIIVGAVHGVFALPDIVRKIEKNCDLLFVTDSIPTKDRRLKILKLPRAV